MTSINNATTESGLHPSDMDIIEIHDCFAITALIIYEHLGFAEPGTAVNLNEEFWRYWSGKINPSGGLLAYGHPIGATGVRMLHSIYQQISSSAGDMQIKNSNCGMMVNMGGMFGSNYAAVVEKSEIWERVGVIRYGQNRYVQGQPEEI